MAIVLCTSPFNAGPNIGSIFKPENLIIVFAKFNIVIDVNQRTCRLLVYKPSQLTVIK